MRLIAREGRATARELAISIQRSDRRSGASLGHSQFHPIAALARREAAGLPRQDSVLVAVPDDEAVWLGLTAKTRKYALHVVFAGLDAASGEPAHKQLRSDPQNYVVCPPQLWLDGVYVEGRLTRRFYPDADGPSILTICVYESSQAAAAVEPRSKTPGIRVQHGFAAEGGAVSPGIARDTAGPRAWKSFDRLRVCLVPPRLYTRLTGREPQQPASPEDRYQGFPLP